MPSLNSAGKQNVFKYNTLRPAVKAAKFTALKSQKWDVQVRYKIRIGYWLIVKEN